MELGTEPPQVEFWEVTSVASMELIERVRNGAGRPLPDQDAAQRNQHDIDDNR
jgi:hypothetical protein